MKIVSTNWKPLSVLSASLFLAACGGGGGGSSDVAAPGSTPSNPGSSPVTPTPTQTTTVTGSVTKGPVANSNIELFRADQFGSPLGAAVASGTSSADGTFTIAVDASIQEDLLLVASGGSFVDESDTTEPRRSITLSATDTFLSVLPQGVSSVAVTPVTTALVVRGRVLAGPDGTFSQKFSAAKADFDAQAGFDVLTTIPANPITPAATATEAQKQYALLLGGIANLVNNVAIQSGAAAPTYDMVVAVTFDLVDGQFDGQYFGSTDVPGSTATPVQLPQNLNFANEVNRFRNNNFANFDGTVLPSIEVTGFGNTFPTANAGADIPVHQAAQAQLDASASTDAESGLFYNWTQSAGTTVTLSSATVAQPTFTAPNKLVGTETLTFDLTVIDAQGFTGTDSVNVTVTGALANDFFVTAENDVGDGVGVDIDGGGRITLTDATNGSLFLDDGSFPFTYTTTDTVLTLNFATPFLDDDFDEERDLDNDGQNDGFFLIEDRVDRFEFTLVTDNPNGDALTIRAVGNTLVLPLNAAPGTAPLATEVYDDTEALLAFDAAQAQPFVIAAGDRRTLQYDSSEVIPTLNFDDELHTELFEFTDATNGRVLDSNTAFTYQVVNGILEVAFATGDSAKYTNITTRPTGDVVAAEYTLNTPFFPGEPNLINDVRLSIPENSAVAKPVTRADAAGVYSGTFEALVDDLDTANLDVRLNPDGTGSVNFDNRANQSPFFDFPDVFAFRSSVGVCWDVDANGDIIIDRTFSLNTAYPGSFSSETDLSLCSALTEEFTDFQVTLTLLDQQGNTYKHFDRTKNNRCQFVPTSDCGDSPVLDLTEFGLRITTREALTAVPPLAALDSVQTADATPITINLLANDIQRENPITGVVINNGPFQGAISSVDLAAGTLVYTPTAGIRSDVIEYQAIDSAGNKSQKQIAQIDINPCPSVDGTQAFFDIFSGDCDYSGLGGLANPVLTDLNLGPLPNGGVHRFFDSLIIGQDYNTNAALATATITAGGTGPSLNIAAGTVLAFSNVTDTLSISRGSQINVGGTPTAPVIMTSQQDIDDERDRANGGPGFHDYNSVDDWGGLVILGFGRVNSCAFTGTAATNDLALSGECHVQAYNVGHFGGDNNADSSGAINYLQIKHTGYIGSDENAGLSLGGVGSGTAISNVQVYSARGDGYALVGGAVSLQNIVAQYTGIAGVLVDLGYVGGVTNGLLIQDRFTGELCVDSFGSDDDIFTPAQIDGLISQGIVSNPVFSNMTCVVSADSFPSGDGYYFDAGSRGTLVDSIAFVPGKDIFSNECFDASQQSLQAVQDGQLFVASNLFACPTTSLAQLPNLTLLQTFIESSGNQFAALSPGTSNPPPVLSAGSGNVLLEGSPLIYAPAQADLMLDGSPVTATPTGTFIGAVQQGANDWTQDWTFGLHPNNREVPLWYEVPIVIAPGFVPSSKGQLVTLDASQSTGPNPRGLSFQWNQLNGDPVTFSNPTGASTQLTAPGAGTNLTQPGGFVLLELVITDSAGLVGKQEIGIPVDASIPADFYAATESIIPFQFNRSIEGGARLIVNADNTGTYKDESGSTAFTWTDSPTDFNIDFTVAGGLIGPAITKVENVAGIGVEITRTKRIDQLTFTLLSDNGPKKTFQQIRTGVNNIFDVTNNVARPDEVFANSPVNSSNIAIVGVDNVIDFSNVEDNTVVLPTNASVAIPTLFNPTSLISDLLTFNEDGTGMAKHKNAAFTYSVDFGKLNVAFADGDFAEYSLLFNRPDGDAVGVTYVGGSGEIAGVYTTVFDETFSDFQTQPSLEGTYITNERVELNDGTFTEAFLSYRIHPDGAGVLESEILDPANGNVIFVFSSTFGICWELISPNQFVWYRTEAFKDDYFIGGGLPLSSSCANLNSGSADPTLIGFQRDISLLTLGGSGELLTFTENRNNQFDPVAMTGDNTVIEFTDTFLRNFDSIVPFAGNPPVALPDTNTVSEGILSFTNVTSNDRPGDVGFNSPPQVEIVVPPAEGIANVDLATGDIEYTPNAGHSGTDFLQYRVTDINGNKSTVGTVNFSVSP